MDLKNIKASLTTAAAEAKTLVSDKTDGQSPFAASVRSNLDHAADLLAEHEKWVAANVTEKIAASRPAAKPAA